MKKIPLRHRRKFWRGSWPLKKESLSKIKEDAALAKHQKVSENAKNSQGIFKMRLIGDLSKNQHLYYSSLRTKEKVKM